MRTPSFSAASEGIRGIHAFRMYVYLLSTICVYIYVHREFTPSAILSLLLRRLRKRSLMKGFWKRCKYVQNWFGKVTFIVRFKLANFCSWRREITGLWRNLWLWKFGAVFLRFYSTAQRRQKVPWVNFSFDAKKKWIFQQRTDVIRIYSVHSFYLSEAHL